MWFPKAQEGNEKLLFNGNRISLLQEEEFRTGWW
jgi:hypothetical protein